MARFRSYLSYANVTATLALIFAMTGGAYAALTIPKNAVGPKQIKKNAVRAKQIKKNAVRSSEVKNASLRRADFKAGQLPAGAPGPQGVPGPQGAGGARGPEGPSTGPAGGALTGSYPNPGLAAPEPLHIVGAAGQPEFQSGFFADSEGGAGFYKDALGRVHFFGLVDRGANVGSAMFELPTGYRPSVPRCMATTYKLGVAYICVVANGRVHLTNAGSGSASVPLLLDGLSFRAEQ